MLQCAFRSFRLAPFTYLRCCFQSVLSLSLAILALWDCFCFECFQVWPHPPSLFSGFMRVFFYEEWKTAMSYFVRGAYMFSFDLKSGYHHVEIFEGRQTYLGFSWKHSNSNQVKLYVFRVLPFGLSSTPHEFTKNP